MQFSPAPADISIAVQVSVKYVRKVNGTPSSSNGMRYLSPSCSQHFGLSSLSFACTHRRSINSN